MDETVQVKIRSGLNIYIIQIKKSDTIQKLKEEFHKKTLIPLNFINLIY